MAKKHHSELFLTARSESEKKIRTFYVYSESAGKMIEAFDADGFPHNHYCDASIKSVMEVIVEIETVYDCKITAIKYWELPYYRKYP